MFIWSSGCNLIFVGNNVWPKSSALVSKQSNIVHCTALECSQESYIRWYTRLKVTYYQG